MKTCSKCKETKESSEFSKTKKQKTGLHSYCKECSKLKAREWRANNPLAAAKSSKKWRETNLELSRQLSKNWASKNKYKVAMCASRRRELVFTLSEAEYYKMISSSCYYCGGKDNIGIDRVDNSIGYTPENSKPCCTWCNKMKLDKSENEFVSHIIKIMKNLGRM